MPFEVYRKKSAPRSKEPLVTVQKRGLVSLNKAAFRMLGEPHSILFLWDAQRNIIGITPTAPDNPDAYATRRQGTTDQAPAVVSGAAFMRHVGLNLEQAHRWSPRLEDGVLCLDVKPEQMGASTRQHPWQ